MNEIGERYLPVGTVVMLKGGSKRVMIAGFCAMSDESGEKIYDYSGCLYPEGFISSTQTCLFDHEQIERVDFIGFIDEEEVAFKKKLKVLVDQINNTKGNNVTDANVSEPDVLKTSDSNDISEDEFIKNFPGPIDDAIKAVKENAINNVSEDEFIKNFPGPIDDAVKYVNERDNEDIVEIVEEVPEVIESVVSNNSSFQGTNTIEF